MRHRSQALLCSAALFFTTALASDDGDIVLRARLVEVAPTEDRFDFALEGGAPGFDVENYLTMEVDVSMFLTKRIAYEFAVLATTHDFIGTGAFSGEGEVAEAWMLIPTATLQYHFRPRKRWNPYLGAGFHRTVFFGEQVSRPLEARFGEAELSVEGTTGYVLQAGFDRSLSDGWAFNVDIRYLDLKTDAVFETEAGDDIVGINLDPVLVGFGIGKRF
ncbi:OmpW family protein [Parvularcula sp. ZS-1/3]|uniref:OmpW family protein n=1 Tax=Parvularcula mediterranea TaxID=2732508 RepID=A0A7Y3RNX9_9PROT|nr:OmpW family outer membrane protein [Parvularcula mediterranea]NNU17538.1 OmpW family protein [Parvularcula mediterranea]